MLFKKKTDYYSLNLNRYIAQIREGNLQYLPWVFCVFSENSDTHKQVAASILSEVLKRCSIDDISRIDKQMRETTSVEWGVNWQSLNVKNFVTKQMSEDEVYAVFAFASFHSNGYVREQAIHVLMKYRNSLPFILLRCNDWICQVRQAALNVLPQKLVVASSEEIVYALPLMEKLRRSERCGYSDILPIVRKAFQVNDQLIRQGLCSKDVRARRFCISLLSSCKGIDHEYLQGYILRERDPFLRRMCFQTLLKTNADHADTMELGKRFLSDKYPPNRVMALQYLYDSHTNVALDIAIHMLVDKNAQVRALSRYIISESGVEVDIHQIYVDALHRQTAIGIYGLGETGCSEDAALIEKFLKSESVLVVRAAMTSLMRLNSEKYIPMITHLLATEQAGIVKTATLLLKKNGDYNIERVLEILKCSSNENTKMKCAALLFSSGKWQSLIYALMLVGSGYEKLEALAQAQITRWIFRYNRSYAVPSENDQKMILKLISEKGKYLTQETAKQIAFLAK